MLRGVNKVSKVFYYLAFGWLLLTLGVSLFTGNPLTEAQSKFNITVAMLLGVVGAIIGIVLNLRAKRDIKFETGVFIGIAAILVFGNFI